MAFLADRTEEFLADVRDCVAKYKQLVALVDTMLVEVQKAVDEHKMEDRTSWEDSLHQWRTDFRRAKGERDPATQISG